MMGDSWDVKDVGSVKTPFDIEAILQACPELYEAWKVRPFYLTKALHGHIIIRYMDEERDISNAAQ